MLNAGEWAALALSARVGVVATLVSLPVGIALGWWLARTRSRWRPAVETVLALPLVLPPVVTGYFLLVVLGPRGALGSWLAGMGLELAFTWRAAAVAAAVLGFPLMVRTIQVAVQAVDPALEQAARTLGATRMQAFRRVTLPLARGGITAGALLAFARSVGEFGATIIFAGNIPGETRTLPLAIYTGLQSPGGEATAMRLGLLSVLLAVAALGLGEWIRRRDRSGA
ncbi:MAG: molybdate ABC transporter permease subunit [Gemmatimonadetes bacterium]|nr:molybdate ABC transporter permease subunit [Gemmatimonadota bacterium]